MTKAEKERQIKLQENKLGIIELRKLTLGVTFEIIEYDKPTADRRASKISQLIQKTEKGHLLTIIYPSELNSGSVGSYLVNNLRITIINHTLNIEWKGFYKYAYSYLDSILICKRI